MMRSRRWMGVTAVLCGALAWTTAAGPAEDAAAASERGDVSLATRLYKQALTDQPQLAEDEAFMRGMHRAEARLAFEAGSRLHAEGEYEPAIELFIQAIAKDAELKIAYAALDDAQRAAMTTRFSQALDAADRGDLPTARNHLEQAIVLGGAASEQVAAAAASIGDPTEAFNKSALDKLAEARRLAEDRRWGSAGDQLAALVEAEPLLLPARAELSRVTRFKQLSVSLTDDAAALIQDKRLSPALEKLAGATSVWPNNTRAAELLETVEQSIQRAQAKLDEAQQQFADENWQAAYETVEAALDIDPSHAGARSFRSEARARYVQQLTEQAAEAITAGDFGRAKLLIDRSNELWPNNPDTRTALARYHGSLAGIAYDNDEFAVAMLRYRLADRYGDGSSRLDALEEYFIDQADASYRLDVAQSSPAIGVSSSDLESALSARSRTPFLRPTDDADAARYTISVRITDTNVDLRQRGGRQIAYSGGGFGYTGTYTTNSVGYWEKYGYVRGAVMIRDNATGQVVRQWNASRWANYTDRQQYVVGQTWNTSYWTLPTDEAVEHRLARDLAAEVWPQAREAVTLARARALRDQGETLADEDPSAALDRRVTAVVLAGQINRREAEIELRKMAEQLDASAAKSE